MKTREIISLLYTVYSAGFAHGSNEGAFPKTGTVDAFSRLIEGESPLNDNISYSIKDKMNELILPHRKDVCIWDKSTVTNAWYPRCNPDNGFTYREQEHFEYCPHCGNKIERI